MKTRIMLIIYCVLISGLFVIPMRAIAANITGSTAFAGLRLVKGPLALRLNIDDETLTSLGADPSFKDRLIKALESKIKAAGIETAKSAAVGTEPTLTIFMWARTLCCLKSTKVIPYKYEFTLTVPEADLSGKNLTQGLIIVWEDEIYGTVGSDPGLIDALTQKFLSRANTLVQDFKACHGNQEF